MEFLIIFLIIVAFISFVNNKLSTSDKLIQTPKYTNFQSRNYLRGTGSYAFPIKGESYYQDNLKIICGGRTWDGVNKTIDASLIFEDDNPKDDKAIRVDIKGKTVGYIGKEDNARIRTVLSEKGFNKRIYYCSAKIIGGWYVDMECQRSFGVFLDLPNFLTTKSYTVLSNNPYEIEFKIDKLAISQLKYCTVDDYVNLWKVPDENTVIIYRAGSCGGMGKLGYVPMDIVKTIAHHVDVKSDLGLYCGFDASISELSEDKCKIRCKLFSEEEVQKLEIEKINNDRENLLRELRKTYNPKKPIICNFYDFAREHNLDEHNLKVGEKVNLNIRDIDYYSNYPFILHIDLIDKNGNTIVTRCEKQQAIRVIRAHYSGYQLNVIVKGIDENAIQVEITPWMLK